MIAAPPYTLVEISSDPTPYDFTFEIDGKKYQCHKSQLLGISSKITKETNYFHFDKLKDPRQAFQSVIELISGKSIEIDEYNGFFLHKIGEILGISQLVEKTKQYEKVNITFDNIFEVTRNLADYNLDISEECNFIAKNFNILKNKHEIKTLPVSVLDQVIESPNFVIKDSIELYDWIKPVVESNGHEYCTLFSHCDMTKLPRKIISEIIDIISFDTISQKMWECFGSRLDMKVEPESNMEEEEYSDDVPQIPQQPQPQMRPQPQPQPKLTQGFWQVPKVVSNPQSSFSQQQAPVAQKHPSFMPKSPSIPFPPKYSTVQQEPMPSSAPASTPEQPKVVVPFKSSNTTTYADEEEENVITLNYSEDYFLNGVISYIKEVYDREWTNEVKVTGGGTKSYQLNKLFDYDNLDSWWDNYDSNKKACTKENAWIQIELLHYSLKLESYSLVSTAEKPRQHQPKSWVIEVSNDGKNWEIVDTVTNCMEMNVPKPKQTFNLKKPTAPIHFFKFIMRQNHAKPDGQNAYELSLGALELYGILIEDAY